MVSPGNRAERRDSDTTLVLVIHGRPYYETRPYENKTIHVNYVRFAAAHRRLNLITRRPSPQLASGLHLQAGSPGRNLTHAMKRAWSQQAIFRRTPAAAPPYD